MDGPKLTRRGFLKWGAATTLLLALGRQFGGLVRAEELIKGGRSVSRTTGLPRKAVPSTCLQCPARCGILGFLEDERLVKIEGNPKDPNSQGRLCAKGQAGISQVYDPDRLLFPMRRRGPRGQGSWQRISWDEAYQEIASRLRAIGQAGRPEEFTFVTSMEGLAGLTGRFLRAFGTPSVLDEMAGYYASKQAAQELTWGASQDINDLARTKYILNFGANPYESHPLYLPLIQRLVNGRMDGAKLVTFDPRLSNTAAKSDEWLPVRPGTDAAVALAMANVIVQSRLYDREFMEKWTNYPLESLAQHLSSYTPEWAEGVSGIAAADIKRIATEFATTKPATTLSGGGVSLHLNGTQAERAVSLLNAITGNIDVRGGYCLPRTYQLTEPQPIPPEPTRKSGIASPWELSPASRTAAQGMFPMIKEGRQKVSLLMTYMSNPIYSNPDTRTGIEVTKDEGLIPFYVACDTHITESAALADIVLPVATYLERWEIQSMPAYDMVPFVSLMQPVLPPPGEARPFHDVCLHLAREIGGGMEAYFNFGSMEDYIAAAISGIEGLAKAGGLNYLKANGAWFDAGAQPVYKAYQQEGFRTPSGKFEIYSRTLEEKGFSPLPIYQPIPNHQNLKEDELILVVFQWNVHTYSRTANCMWLSEIVHDNPVWINPETARARGIKKGDPVKITSKVGSITSRAWLTQGVSPNVLAIGACVGHWESGRIAKAERFKSTDPNTELLWWDKHGNGVHPHNIIPVAPDPIGGGQAWMDTTVTLSRD